LTILFCLSTAISQLNAAKAASMHEQEEVGPGGAGSGKAHSGSYCLFGIKTENPCEKPVDFVKWVLSWPGCFCIVATCLMLEILYLLSSLMAVYGMWNFSRSDPCCPCVFLWKRH
jgi:hypothetical protein